jgi:hypothetical protein
MCGSVGGTCGETPGETAPEWEIPAGAPPHSAFTFSYSVTVSSATALPTVVAKLTYSGPGCPTTSCVYDTPQTGVPGRVTAASAQDATVIRIHSEPIVRSSPTTDVQSIEVVVPECKTVGSKPNDKTRVKCSGTPGPGTPAPGKGKSPSGLVFTTKPSKPSGLAHTGVDLIRGIQAGLLSIGSGALLLLLSKLTGRRRVPTLQGT